MRESVQAPGGATVTEAATVRETGPMGMVSLRVRPDVPGLAAAIGSVPGARQIVTEGPQLCAWMSPDEFLLLMPPVDVRPALDRIAAGLAGKHYLAVDVSDARALFRIEGTRAKTVISRLCPVDVDCLPEGEMRRTRLAQVACALWRDRDGLTVIVFRSVARYARQVLADAAR